MAATGYEVELEMDWIRCSTSCKRPTSVSALPGLRRKHGKSLFDSSTRVRALSKLVDAHPDKDGGALLQPFKNVRHRSNSIQRTVHQELPFPHNAVVRAGLIVSHPLTIAIFFWVS